MEPEGVPENLVHGTCRRHLKSIRQHGLLRQSRDLHLHDPLEHSERWRKDLESKVVVDTQTAMEKGCSFRKTGNLVWLCGQDIPPQALSGILGRPSVATPVLLVFLDPKMKATNSPENAI